MLESLFNKMQALKTRLQHKCFPVKTSKFSRAAFLKNFCEQLLLNCDDKVLDETTFKIRLSMKIGNFLINFIK